MNKNDHKKIKTIIYSFFFIQYINADPFVSDRMKTMNMSASCTIEADWVPT